MNWNRSRVVTPKHVRILAAVILGLGVGTAVPPKTVSLPGLGPTPGLAVGGLGLLVGAALYVRAPTLAGSPDAAGHSDCGCGGDCQCS